MPMTSVDERLAQLRARADVAPDGAALDWACTEQAVMAGFALRRQQAQARRQLAWTGALALAVGLAGGLAQQQSPLRAPQPGDDARSLAAGPLALPPQAPSVVLLGAG